MRQMDAEFIIPYAVIQYTVATRLVLELLSKLQWSALMVSIASVIILKARSVPIGEFTVYVGDDDC